MTRTARIARTVALALALLATPHAGVRADDGPGGGPGGGPGWERMEKRMRLARSLGLAEALDLDEAGAARMNAVMSGFDARRKAILQQVRADVRVLKGVAQAPEGSDGAQARTVEESVARIFDGRAELVALDREMFQALAKGLAPAKQARMALFFAQFRQRFGMEIMEKRR